MKSNLIAIVGVGCVLPEVFSYEEFKKRLYLKRSVFFELKNRDWVDKYYSRNKSEIDKSYTKFSGSIDYSKVDNLMKKLDLYETGFDKTTKISVLAIHQVFSSLKFEFGSKIDPSKVDLNVGFSTPDESFDLEYYSEGKVIQNTPLNTILKLREIFDIKGEYSIIDSACATSLAALDVSCLSLIHGDKDLVISGGVDANLSEGTFVPFSKVKALAEDNNSYPFDKRSTGFVVSEGSVFFALKRYSDAIKDNNTIFGVIEKIGSSSDGNSVGIFSPSVEGQLLSYKRTYSNNEFPQYVECHGTGTKIGDEVELKSCDIFFPKDTLIGSSKSIFGHTRAAAGSVGLLKALTIFETNKIPSNYYLNSVRVDTKNIKLNLDEIQISDLTRIGVSSFGFGNINYHMSVLNPNKISNHVDLKNGFDEKDIKLVSVSESVIEESDKTSLIEKFSLKIPDLSKKYIDILQIKSIAAFKDILSSLNLDSKSYMFKKNTFIISLTEEGKTDSRFAGIKRLSSKDNKKYPEISEDTIHGSINNVVAGRVSNMFDLYGGSFNLDSGSVSFPLSLKIIKNILKSSPETLVYLAYDASKENGTFRGILITSEEYALSSGLPIKNELNVDDC